MRLKAYVLAADPAWIEDSVLSYYGHVDEIIVSYDEARRGWSGVPIPVDEIMERLKKIDGERKVRFCGGNFFRPEHHPLDNDTYQRQHALSEAGRDADWVLELDADEILPRPERLIDLLKYASAEDIGVLEWPMRVFFRRLQNGGFLEVCAPDRSDCYEYPGPVACRPNAKLTNARRAEGPFLRAVVKGDRHTLQVNRPTEPNERRIEFCEGSDAILHFSWARSAEQIRKKIASWGHNDGLKTWWFYYGRWNPSPYLWPWMRDFHPAARGVWPALRHSSDLPLPFTKCLT